MRHLFRTFALALTLFGALSFGASDRAEARTHFSFSVGVPLGYYGGPYYGGGFGYRGHFGGPRWSAYYGGAWPSYYRPYRYGYYTPRPTYYPREYYRSRYSPYDRGTYGPIYSLGLFPAYVGDALGSRERGLYFDAYNRALAAPVGQSIDWNSGNFRGAITTTRDGWAGEKYCREFRQDVIIDGKSQEATGTACRQPDGDWQLVANQ